MTLVKTFIHMKLILRTLLQTVGSLKESRQSVLIPFFLGLTLAAIVLFFINSVSPLAPFVYSLF